MHGPPFLTVPLILGKASVNYEKIAEGLSRALQEIGEAVDGCVKDSGVYRTQTMQYNVANLYAHIFFFLRNTIDWYARKSIKRALSSLKEDFYDRFEEEISNIKRISAAIGREAQHGSHSELRYTRLLLEKLAEDTVIGLQDRKRDEAERRYREEIATRQSIKEREAIRALELEKLKRLDDLHKLIGASAKALFLERASTFIGERTDYQSHGGISFIRALGGHCKLTFTAGLSGLDTYPQLGPFDLPPLSDSNTKGISSYPAEDKQYSITSAGLSESDGYSDPQYHSRQLEDSIICGQVIVPYDPSVRLFFDWQVVAALQEWTASTSSQIINVVGPSQTQDVSATASIASHTIELATQSKIPVVSFFCDLPQRGTVIPDNTTPEIIALVSLTYALIRQLIEVSPYPTKSSPHTLGRGSFERLNGQPDSLDVALDLLGQLLESSTPILICVVDGLEKLDGPRTRRHLVLLLEKFRGRREGKPLGMPKRDCLLKILLTTAGRSRCLLDSLSRDELVFAERSGSERRLCGKGRPGRRSLSPRLLAPITLSTLE